MDEERKGWGLFGLRRGRPARPPGNPLGEHLRNQREGRGWTIRRLAKEIGMPETSAGYLSQLETGSKVPSPEVAERLAARLGDRRGIFRLWSMTGRRADPRTAAQARRELARLFDDRSLTQHDLFTPPTMASVEPPQVARPPVEKWRELPPSAMAPETRGATEPLDEPAGRRELSRSDRLRGMEELARSPAAQGPVDRITGQRMRMRDLAMRVPLLPEGMDPRELRGDPLASFEHLRLEPDALPATRLVRPFAYRLSAEGARRVRHLVREGDITVMTCETLPIVRHEVYGVRLERRIVLSEIIWNESELLVLPAPEDSDFVVIPADRRTLEDVVVARLATVVGGSARIVPHGWPGEV